MRNSRFQNLTRQSSGALNNTSSLIFKWRQLHRLTQLIGNEWHIWSMISKYRNMEQQPLWIHLMLLHKLTWFFARWIGVED